jgi:predicted transcriptional regulator of viral defense system
MADKRRPEAGHRPLAELATRQHGVVSARQLLLLGYSRDQVSGEVARGRLLRLHRGVYAVGHGDLSWPGRCLAAVLASAPALASHASAGRLWGLLGYDPQTLDVTAATGRRPHPEVRVHRARLAEPDEAEVVGVPVTSVARTALDLAASLRPESLERALERAEELRIFDLAAVEELLARVTHHPGTMALKGALAKHRDHPAFTRSGLERRFLSLVLAADLPPPSMNFNVAGLELDAYWEPERFGVELDVFKTHGTRAAFERDRLRDEDLKLAGIELIRVTGPRLDREPARVIERIAVLLERRRRELGLRPKVGGAR